MFDDYVVHIIYCVSVVTVLVNFSVLGSFLYGN